jgi:hypothetical protein
VSLDTSFDNHKRFSRIKPIRACALKRFACLREAASAGAGRASVSFAVIRANCFYFLSKLE